MCGFVGAYSTVNNINRKLLSAISKIAWRRGPDDTGYWGDEFYKVVFNRLSILELTLAGHQPMISPSDNWVIVFNGEIYNHLELRSELPSYNYKGRSDTETIVWGIENWGFEQTIEKLNGMFAIAAYNKIHKDLWLARDFAGIKPLYYSNGQDGIWFASQFNQIVQGLGKKTVTLYAQGMRDYLQLGYMQAPHTIYKEIKQVIPGEIVKFNFLKRQSNRRFYELPAFGNLKENNKTGEYGEFSELMSQVVKDQMLSDVPIGSFLSSGIDSTLIAGFASKSHKNITTFTIGTKNYEGDESQKAREYSDILNLDHKSKIITEEEVVGAVDKSIDFHSEPFGDYSSIPTFLITKYAKEHSTVMLSGDGGDELFWGYPRWNKFLKFYDVFKYPRKIRQLQGAVKRRFGKQFPLGPANWQTPGEWVLNSQSHNGIGAMNEIMPGAENSPAIQSLYQFNYGPSRLAFRNWLRWNEFYAHLQRVLIKVDRMSMANSLEVRVPFLDKRIIEFSWNQNSSYGRSHFNNKTFLKKQLTQFIPSEKMNCEKFGFSVPMEKWLRENLKSLVLEKLLDKNFYGEEFINKQFLHQYINDFFAGKHNFAWGIWILYTWQKWGDYIDSSE
jgi:asparagine synthase (glutamine-hydrolysing)